ncbi:MAG TPA: sigma-70 family RNA polymerase sigma factor [Gaiellaceae bacterium]|nr:sigma-70 family RNA polymerase sigma factor [Gaiellaceae bacterium]
MEPEPTDAALVARCRSGDDSAWTLLVERFSRYVYAICSQGFRLGRHDTEDVFQDVFTRAYENLPKLRNDDAIRPWLAQLTRRLCIDHLRDATREVPVEELEPDGMDELIETLDDALTVREAMARIGEPCGDMLDRFFARDQSYRTIGEELDLPAGTIASRISRCLEKLKAAMEDSEALVSPEVG